MSITFEVERHHDGTEHDTGYAYAAEEFKAVMQRKRIYHEWYTTKLIDLLDTYPDHFNRQREAPENRMRSAAEIIESDARNIIGDNGVVDVNQIALQLDHFLNDEASQLIRQQGCDAAPRAATFALLACIDEIKAPHLLYN